MTDELLRKEVELKFLWLTHTLSENEKTSLENCVIDMVLGSESADGERERIAFNKGLIWATEYLTLRGK
jgi:hypothetical protein